MHEFSGTSDALVAGEPVGGGKFSPHKEQRTRFGAVLSICLSGAVFLMVVGSRFWAEIQADDGGSRFAEHVAWEWPRVFWYGWPWLVALSAGAFFATLMVRRRDTPFLRLPLTMSVLAMLIAGTVVVWTGATAIRATIPSGETVHVSSIHDIELPAGGTRGGTCCMFATTYYYPQKPEVLASEISQMDGYRVTKDGQTYIGAVNVYISGDRFGSCLTLTYD